MYNDNIFPNNKQTQNNILKYSYSISYLLEYQKIFSTSQFDDSTHSLPILFEGKTSFARFLANEKHRLTFFRSFKKTKKLNEKKKLIKNFHLLSFNASKKHDLPSNNLNIFEKKTTFTCLTHAANFASSILSYKSGEKNIKPIIGLASPTKIDVINFNKKKGLICVERHISYMNNEQTKAALCFILQLNSYLNQNLLPLKKESNKINEFYVRSKKLDVLSKKINDFDTNSTSNIKDTCLEETNDSIDISMELLNNPDYSLEFILNENNDSITFYDQKIMNNSPSVLIKEDNQQISNINIDDRQEIVNENRTDYDRFNLSKIQTIYDEININMPVSEITYATDLSLQQIETSIKSIESIQPKNSTLNRTEINISKYSNKSNENRSLVSFEVANREEHLVEIVELPRSSHRISRMDVYKKIQERLVLNTLIDIDLTGLLRTVSQVFL